MNSNPPAWLPELKLTPTTLQAAAAADPTGSFADLQLAGRSVHAHRYRASEDALKGRALFDALDWRCGGQIAAWMGTLC